MSSKDFRGMRIVDDDIDIRNIIRNIIKTENEDEAFHILNVGDVVAKHKLWLQKVPTVLPHFGEILHNSNITF